MEFTRNEFDAISFIIAVMAGVDGDIDSRELSTLGIITGSIKIAPSDINTFTTINAHTTIDDLIPTIMSMTGRKKQLLSNMLLVMAKADNFLHDHEFLYLDNLRNDAGLPEPTPCTLRSILEELNY